jgi:hypothetical protein
MWTSPKEATSDAACVPIPDPPTPVKNVIVPGDMCETDESCFGADGSVTCSDGKCTTTVKTGDDCPDIEGQPGHKYCPENNYCKDKKCVASIDAGEVCDTGIECKFGLACVASDDAMTEFKCAKLGELVDAKKFDTTRYIRAADAWLGQDLLCKTGVSYAFDEAAPAKRECRQAPKSDATTEDALKQPSGDGADCAFTQWNDPADAAKAVPSKDASFCGFNTEGAGYCSKRKGDSWYNTVRSSLISTDPSSVACHLFSGVGSCKAFYDALNTKESDLPKHYYQNVYEVSIEGGYANVAENDDCTKKTITQGYWMVDSDYAMNLGMTSVIAMIMSLSALLLL